MREIVALASRVVHRGGCVVEGVMGVATTSFQDRFCERHEQVNEERGPES
jgi:hypothetical protein